MTPTYRADIDGLRALAVVPVVLFHAGLAGLPGGFVGVDVFFVISGFLITQIIHREIAAGEFSLARFYERRARRILPALFTVLIATLISAWCILLPDEFEKLAKTGLAALGFASNIWFWRDGNSYFGLASEYKPFLHTWSLAVEEQFYIFFPLLLLALNERKPRWLLKVILATTVFSLALAVWMVSARPAAAFYLLPSRAWELGFGALLALGVLPIRLRRALREVVGGFSLISVILTMVFLDRETPFPGLTALPPVAGAAGLIWVGGTGGSFANSLLALRPMVFIGLISYSFYLWHWPIMALARSLLAEIRLPQAIALLTIALSFGLAILSWRFVERPFRRRSARSRGSAGALRAAGTGIALLALVMGSVVVTHGVPQRFDPAQLAWMETIAGPDLAKDPCMGPRSIETLCHFGAKGVEPKTLIWGDSHALAARPGVIDGMGGDQAFLFASHNGCPPLPGVRRVTQQPATPDTCVTFGKSVEQMLIGSSIDTVILAARWALYIEGTNFPYGVSPDMVLESIGDSHAVPTRQNNNQVVRVALSQLSSELRAAGKRVILLGPIPEMSWDPRGRVIRERRFGLSLPSDPKRSEVEQRQARADRILRQVALETGAVYLPVTPAMCGDTCPTADGDEVFYFDNDHLSEAGALRFIAPLIRSHFAAVGR